VTLPMVVLEAKAAGATRRATSVAGTTSERMSSLLDGPGGPPCPGLNARPRFVTDAVLVCRVDGDLVAHLAGRGAAREVMLQSQQEA
jgi:hypothetical protein